MFLKRIEMQGFKSFADKTVINFNSQITGIVGPNGCGKSNINDAIRWVLGEQSPKSLRGNNMSDVIFSGSSNRKPVNLAEVTLVLDNSDHVLPSDYKEIEITRRLNRLDNTGEYLINNQQVRLKDIIDLTLDSGLGRESLGIITQGNINSFADAKPIDRRGFFEEAAGVAKYKKRKHDSELSLDRTQANLERLNDIVDEISKQVEPLKRQAKRAESYLEKKTELEKIEVAVLVAEIQNYDKEINKAADKLRSMEAEKLIGSTQIMNLEKEITDLKNEQRQLDSDIGGLQEQLIKVTEDIQNLELRKVEIDERRKYQLDHAGDAEKIAQQKQIVAETEFAYKDQKQRYLNKQAELELANQKLEQLNNRLNNTRNELQKYNENLRHLENQRDVLKAQAASPYEFQQGVAAIVKARENLPGILDVVADAIKPAENYEMAISTSLAGAMYHIITTDESAARNAISFLKRNNSGRATFLPINVMRPSYVSQEVLIVAQDLKGYLGTAKEFVQYDPTYENIAGYLLGSTLITDNLENANELARRIHYSYKIVTLEGDIVHRGGSMSGGYQKNYYSPLTIESQKRSVEKKLEETKALGSNLQTNYDELNNKVNGINDEVLTKRIEFAKMDPVLNSAKNNYEAAKAEYERLNPNDKSEIEKSENDDLLSRLNGSYAKRDEISTSIRLKNERRIRSSAEVERKDNQIRTTRRDLAALEADDRQLELDKTKYETQKENSLARLNREYQMTLEHAEKLSFDIDLEQSKQKVLILRQQITNLGTVNLDAPEQYKEINQRYTYLKEQYDDLVASRQKILDAIKDMDEYMFKQFKETFQKINEELPGIFVKLFGGGKAKLVLEDPDDLLNTGIDIDVQPPGKAIQNIRLFSGGEKTLIAISVLFAILKARPVPLCLFDEIDSALDTSNVDRFATYLKDFSGDTQFIVVTHRTGTMEKCDELYGVTMPSQGITQMLKVKISDAVELANKNATQGENV